MQLDVAYDTVALGTARVTVGRPLFGIALRLSWLMLRLVMGQRGPVAD